MGLKYDSHVGPMIVDETTGRLIGYQDDRGVSRYLDGRAMASSENGAGEAVSIGSTPSRYRTVTVSGDSFTARTHQAYIPSATSVSNGVCTFTNTSHGLPTGTLINATGGDSDAINVVRASITKTGANTFTFPCPGYRDGSVGTGVATFQVTAWSQQTLEGVFSYLNTMAGGAFELIQNAGHSGYRMADVLGRYGSALESYPADLHIHWGYFNDMQYGVTPEASASYVQQILLRRKAQGALCATVSAIPVPSGVYTWPTLTAPLTTLTDATAAAWVLKWNRLMRAFCAENKMIFADVHKYAADPSNGYARTGWCKSADIHPSAVTNYRAAKEILAQLNASMYQPFLLAQSSLDNVAADSTNPNICRFLPAAQGTGGSVGSGVTATATAWATGAIAAQRWRTNAGNLYYTAAGGTATGGNAPTHTSGSVTTADGITWVYVGAAPTSAGVPQGWGVYGTGSTLVAFSQLVTRADGRVALRVIAIASAANDQLRISYTGSNSDIAEGNILTAAALVSLSTSINATNATPAGQNMKAFTAQYVGTFGSDTSTWYEARGSTASASEMINEDIVDGVRVVPNVLIPSGTVTLSRFDAVIAQFSGAGMCVIDVVAGTIYKS